MAFDPSKPFGFHLGGALDGCRGQTGSDGKNHNYRPDGTEVDDSGKPVKAAEKAVAKPAAKPEEKPDPDAQQLAAQLKS
jgi:hypothetical protein